ncbi:hypothetical protein [Changpingibacter yushuensis]|uniref:hypothetical protein n=1 Tax=Changpingibacter yushuensis TaxID=2758440 RepID=UPI0015F5A9F0|nr:hypothetical protein [Changpingibacter yushuensis]
MASKKPRTGAESALVMVAAAELAHLAKAAGSDLMVFDSLLKPLTKSVLEMALSREMAEHLS